MKKVLQPRGLALFQWCTPTFLKENNQEKIKAPQALRNTPPLLGAPKVIL